jgi:methylated-DNA-[protein]-cysteine S-methyltransferase
MTHQYHLFETALGCMGVAWSGSAVTRFLLPQRDREAMGRKLSASAVEAGTVPGHIGSMIERIRSYASGERVELDDIPVDHGDADDFHRAIYAAARRLAFGVTTTYGALAADAGYPGLARETGAALGRNPVPLIVPCHRIVAAGNKIGGFSAPGGSATKEKLLRLEGARAAPEAAAQAAFAF